MNQLNVRNIAIIAHVDHGKTTLVDALLKQTGAYSFKEGEETVMDSFDLERERGITIFSKNASLIYNNIKINIIDTPGHADFGSEVERTLKMVDGVLLLVDAVEGPKPQTKFVLKKSLALGLKPILVVNKIDRPHVRADEVVNKTFDLFCELNANDEQLGFPIVYASGRSGIATVDLKKEAKDLIPLLDTIVKYVPPPMVDPTRPFQMQVTMLDYDDYVGTLAIGRIVHGKVRVGETIACVKSINKSISGKVTKIMMYKGLSRVSVEEAMAGDIVALAGIEDMQVSDTLTSMTNKIPLPPLDIDEPTLSMNFSNNSSPLSGKDGGKFLTLRQIKERLEHEAKVNVGVKVEPVDNGERLKVSGRGELHLSILIETMRREGYELEVSPPKVIYKEINGKVHEPIELLSIEVPPGFQGIIIQALGPRKALLKETHNTSSGTLEMEFLISSRSLLGFRSEFLTLTRGTGIIYSNFHSYQPYWGELQPKRLTGVLISHEPGKATAYSLWGLQDRGEIFIHPGDAVYEGMIIGVHNKGNDLTVNVIRGKKLTNIRAASADEAIQLIKPRVMTLEFAIAFIEEDELVEITPKSIRLRKRYLTKSDRDRFDRKIKS
ncbi:MAG: GTP-binding protein TypA [Deltaproteobacteria bacterium RIFCSPHIGHO2_12_FULL_43_9]|nr:MAG: GTP-binding protein TypA [Deltaproteobacteria bacterium RIFCSPHIGHO2_12_FULL_43_9]